MGSISDAVVHPWTGGVRADGLYLPYRLLRLPEYPLGGMLTPSRILPFNILESLVTCAYKSSGHPLILRAALPSHVYLLCVPLPAGYMFLSVVAVSLPPVLVTWVFSGVSQTGGSLGL